MALLVRNIPLRLDEPEALLVSKAAKRLGVPPEAVVRHALLRRSLDARKGRPIHFMYHLELALDGGAEREMGVLKRRRLPTVGIVRERSRPDPQPGTAPLPHRPVVIGFGPGGMFAAYELARLGYQPVVYERGRDIRRRHHDVLKKYYRDGVFDPASNLLFGEGGAGTYSDGKLYTRLSDPRVRTVIETLVDHGGDPDLLIDAHPHVGSDKLPTICRRIRLHIGKLGGQVCFDSMLEDVRVDEGRLTSILVNGAWQAVGPVVLAVGHSARDTLRMLAARGVCLTAKPFQLGVRIEHPQGMVDRWQYGAAAGHPRLPPAEYCLVAKGAAGELGDLFSFCMCPGGQVLPSNESAGQVVTNGASKSKRDSPFANAGLVVTIPPAHFGNDALAGLAYQERWERRAFDLTGGTYRVPAQRAADFLTQRPSDGMPETSYPLGAGWADLRGVVPPAVADAVARGLDNLDRRLPGFAGPDAIIMGPETRGSAPVRILRDPTTRCSVSAANLYPVGEGAGYAGGIVSSAIDGLRTAQAIIGTYGPAASITTREPTGR